MSVEESLQDVTIRERQLEAHILGSAEYRHRVDQELKRQVSLLYLAIALLVVYQGLFTLRVAGWIALDDIALTSVTSVLAIITCLLLIQTKTWLRQINEAWLAPQEKEAFDDLRYQRHEILNRLPRALSANENAELN